MFIHFGQQLMGKVDQVPGLFYVSTRFFCFQFLPVIPLGSVLVMDGSEKNGKYRGRPIALSGKSVLFAWSRAALIVAGIGLAIGGVVQLGERQDAVAGGGLLASAASLWVLCRLSYRLSQAGAERAVRLAGEACIPPEVVARAFVANGYRPPAELADSSLEARAED
ncbi:MAG TPA: hypothetical protein VGF55_22050 [Gemmataceae bacterium]|jgi:hypothetical protein